MKIDGRLIAQEMLKQKLSKEPEDGGLSKVVQNFIEHVHGKNSTEAQKCLTQMVHLASKVSTSHGTINPDNM